MKGISKALRTNAPKRYLDGTHRSIAPDERIGVPSQELSLLEQWLPDGHVDQKLEDAVALLHEMLIQARTGMATNKVNFRFQSTYFGEQLRHEAGELRIGSSSCQTILTNSILDELRLESDSYRGGPSCLDSMFYFLSVASR